MLNDADEITRLHRVMEDALWHLDHGYPVGAIATLRGEDRSGAIRFTVPLMNRRVHR
ncbi:MAG: hypothetical protein M3Y48_04400 [Actinomycetota bacterium]|nr:hypothetical protein [Actinomycetota bacterium]